MNFYNDKMNFKPVGPDGDAAQQAVKKLIAQRLRKSLIVKKSVSHEFDKSSMTESASKSKTGKVTPNLKQ